MSIGIIGAGTLGPTWPDRSQRAGFLQRSQTAWSRVACETCRGAWPVDQGRLREEAGKSHVVLVAVRWVDLEKALGGLPACNGRIVIDSTNPVAFLDPDSPERNDPSNPLAAYGIKAIDLGGKHSSEVFREFVPGARVAKAFNHINANILAELVVSGGQRVLFYSGDDADAKGAVRKIIEKTGHFPVDLGALDVGGPLASPPFGPLAAGNFIRV